MQMAQHVQADHQVRRVYGFFALVALEFLIIEVALRSFADRVRNEIDQRIFYGNS